MKAADQLAKQFVNKVSGSPTKDRLNQRDKPSPASKVNFVVSNFKIKIFYMLFGLTSSNDGQIIVHLLLSLLDKKSNSGSFNNVPFLRHHRCWCFPPSRISTRQRLFQQSELELQTRSTSMSRLQRNRSHSKVSLRVAQLHLVRYV